MVFLPCHGGGGAARPPTRWVCTQPITDETVCRWSAARFRGRTRVRLGVAPRGTAGVLRRRYSRGAARRRRSRGHTRAYAAVPAGRSDARPWQRFNAVTPASGQRSPNCSAGPVSSCPPRICTRACAQRLHGRTRDRLPRVAGHGCRRGGGRGAQRERRGALPPLRGAVTPSPPGLPDLWPNRGDQRPGVEPWARVVAEQYGYTDVDHHVELFGCCAACSASDAPLTDRLPLRRD